MDKTISVIVPTLNEENYIGKCLSSLGKQDYDGGFETIVVDGYSTDKTKEIVMKYNAKILDSPRRNIGLQRNLGTQESKGKICFYVDADSVVPKNWMSRLLEEYEKDKNIVMVGTSCLANAGIYTALYHHWALTRKILNKLSVSLIPGSSMSILKNIFYKAGGFPEYPFEDADLSLKARKFGNIKLIDDISVLTSGRGWKRKHAKLKEFVYKPVYALSQGKINLEKITKCELTKPKD